MKRLFIPAMILLVFASILLIPSCAINPVTGKKQLVLISEAQEIAMGAEYNPQIIASYGLYENEELLNLISEKGAEIGKISHRPNLEYHFSILDSPVINAFAVPGGYIYVTRGILAQFNNEAELMGVLGHEIGHVTARHSVQQMTNQQLAQLGLAVGMIASKEFSQFADVASQGLQLLFLKFSRNHENQADRLGVEYASKIGYDTHKMANFFNVLNKMQAESSQGGLPTFLSTHPDPGDRYDRVNELTQVWQDSLSTNNWKVNQESYLRMIDGLVYGEDPRQGFVEGNTFYQPEMKFQFPVPDGWTLANSPSQVQIAPEDGNALIVFKLAGQDTLDKAVSETIESLSLTVLSKSRSPVNGIPAISALSEQVSQNEETGESSSIKVLSYFIKYAGKVYVFHGVSAKDGFDSYSRQFESTMAGFKRLTNPAKINVEPKRVRIKQVRNPGTLAEVFQTFGIGQQEMSDLALLNNMELTDKVERGSLIKVIQ